MATESTQGAIGSPFNNVATDATDGGSSINASGQAFAGLSEDAANASIENKIRSVVAQSAMNMANSVQPAK
jgi:hypothetical protein